MFGRVLPGGLHHVHEPGQVGIHIGMRIFRAVTHSGLRGQVNDEARLMGRDALHDSVTIRQVGADMCVVGMLCELCDPCVLQGRVVIGGMVVKTDDCTTLLQKAPGCVKPNKACCPRHQNVV